VQILSYDEAANHIGLARRSLERLISQGIGPATIHISARRRGIMEADLEMWAKSRRHAPPGEKPSVSGAGVEPGE
jgi:predicted DNA-binding transcriptional regulator AlpA